MKKVPGSLHLVGTGAGSLIQVMRAQRTGSLLQMAGTGAVSLIQAVKIEDRFLLTAGRNRGRFFNNEL
jgi:hypothetical protein